MFIFGFTLNRNLAGSALRAALLLLSVIFVVFLGRIYAGLIFKTVAAFSAVKIQIHRYFAVIIFFRRHAAVSVIIKIPRRHAITS